VKSFLLTVAGFDPTGGAGILRDVRTFNRFGFLGASAITANTAQNSKGVREVLFTPPTLLLSQIELILEELPIEGAKFGIAHESAAANERAIKLVKGKTGTIVYDPVISPTLGKSFINNLSAIRPLVEHSSVITPNFSEYLKLKRAFGSLLDEKTLVIKGIVEGETVRNVILERGRERASFRYEKREGEVRGTGCAFSSALLSLLSRGASLNEAVREAGEFLKRYRESSLPFMEEAQNYPLL